MRRKAAWVRGARRKGGFRGNTHGREAQHSPLLWCKLADLLLKARVVQVGRDSSIEGEQGHHIEHDPVH